MQLAGRNTFLILICGLMAALPAQAQMQVGSNFWFASRGNSYIDPFTANADFAGYPNSNPWRPEFVSEIGPYGMLRFMDWQCINSSDQVTWSTRKLPTDPNQSAPWLDPARSDHVGKGIAYEWLIDLGNRTNKDIWLCVPHKADDTFVREMARLVKAKLNSNLKCYIEYSNEVWNAHFEQNAYARERGAALGFSGDTWTQGSRFYGYRSGQIFNIWTQEFTGQTNRIVRVLAGQIGGDMWHANASHDQMVQSTGATADAWAVAPYIGLSVNGNDSNAFSVLYSNTDLKATESGIHKNWAQGKGLLLLAYEGGQHVTTGADTINRDSRMYDLYQYYLDKMAPYYDVFVHYAHASTTYENNLGWGAKEGIGQSESLAHKYRSIKTWINNNGGTPPPPPPNNNADVAAGSPTVDGAVDGVWAGATSYSIGNTTGTISSTSDCSGNFRAMWDASNFYALVEVTDDNKSNDSTNIWEDDSVELYLDGNNDKATSYDANDRQYSFGWGDTAVVEGGGRSSTGVTFAKADPTSTTYRIEAKVPWGTLGVTASSGKKIGLDVHINDDDAGGAREGKKMWNDVLDGAWQNPSRFGTATLQSGGSAPAAPTGLAATAGNGQVALSWNASSGATSYNVKRSTTSGSGYSTINSPTTTSYTNTGLTNGTTYYYVVSAVNSGGESANSGQVSATPTGTTPGGSGTITRDVWTGITGTAVSAIPTSTTPSSTGTLTSFEAPTNIGDNYGQRVRGYLTAPQTGTYTFWIAADDGCELWLGTSDQATSNARIAYHTGWTASREWNKYATQKSASISLTAGQRYYIEALQKEGSGGDNLAVGWAKPGQSTTAPSEVIPGAQLSPWDGGGSGPSGPVANGTYKIVARHSGKALEVDSSSTADGANVRQWTYGGGSNQQWQVTLQSDGFYEIKAVHSNKNLDLAAGATADGTNVQQWTDNDGSAQRWQIVDLGGGYFRVNAKNDTTKCLDVSAISTADGANVLVWTWGGGTNQQWQFLAPGTGGGSQTVTLTPTDDRDTSSDNTAGTNTVYNASKWNHLAQRYSLSTISGTVTNAKLRIYRHDAWQGTITVDAHQGTTDAWTEGGTTPGVGTLIAGTSSSTVAYVEIDVTSFVQSQASGDDVATFCIKTSHDNWTPFRSKEHSSNKPQLVVTYGN